MWQEVSYVTSSLLLWQEDFVSSKIKFLSVPESLLLWHIFFPVTEFSFCVTYFLLVTRSFFLWQEFFAAKEALHSRNLTQSLTDRPLASIQNLRIEGHVETNRNMHGHSREYRGMQGALNWFFQIGNQAVEFDVERMRWARTPFNKTTNIAHFSIGLTLGLPSALPWMSLRIFNFLGLLSTLHFIHLVTKQSFRQNLNYTSNQKTYLTKVATFDILMENMYEKDKIMHSFGHKTVVSSKSKLHIQSKNFSK